LTNIDALNRKNAAQGIQDIQGAKGLRGALKAFPSTEETTFAQHDVWGNYRGEWHTTDVGSVPTTLFNDITLKGKVPVPSSPTNKTSAMQPGTVKIAWKPPKIADHGIVEMIRTNMTEMSSMKGL
jgi:hypothetical protein